MPTYILSDADGSFCPKDLIAETGSVQACTKRLLLIDPRATEGQRNANQTRFELTRYPQYTFAAARRARQTFEISEEFAVAEIVGREVTIQRVVAVGCRTRKIAVAEAVAAAVVGLQTAMSAAVAAVAHRRERTAGEVVESAHQIVPHHQIGLLLSQQLEPVQQAYQIASLRSLRTIHRLEQAAVAVAAGTQTEKLMPEAELQTNPLSPVVAAAAAQRVLYQLEPEQPQQVPHQRRKSRWVAGRAWLGSRKWMARPVLD